MKVKKQLRLFLIPLLACSLTAKATEFKHAATDKLYQTVIKSVEEDDFELMASSYHPDAVLVTNKQTTAITSAIKKWKIAGLKHQAEGGSATLNFRFNKRIINQSSSFEAGIYRYSTIDKSGQETVIFACFEDLNVKKNGRWLTIMENQTCKTTKTAWDKLPIWQ